MPITNSAQLAEALRTAEIIPIMKATTSIAAGVQGTNFRIGTVPAAGVIQAAAAICDHNLLGSVVYQQPAPGNKLHLAGFEFNAGAAGLDVQLHDRIAHMGGLNAILTNLQTTNLPIDISGTGSNLVERRGRSDYRDVLWWIEILAATGATARNLTINYTAHDDTTTSVVITFPANAGVHRLIPFYAADGKGIKSVQSVQLDLSTGTAGNFGIVATRQISGISLGWQQEFTALGPLGTTLPVIPAQACLSFVAVPNATSTGACGGELTIVQTPT